MHFKGRRQGYVYLLITPNLRRDWREENFDFKSGVKYTYLEMKMQGGKKKKNLKN